MESDLKRENIFKKEIKKGITKKQVSYLILAALILVIFLNLGSISNFLTAVKVIIAKYSNYFFKGIAITFSLSFISVIFGIVVGTIIYLMRSSEIKILKFLATAYVELLRGIPLMVQLFIVHFGAATILDYRKAGIEIGKAAFIAGVIAVCLNSGAYVSEIIRGGIQSIDKGQMEAGRSLGMNKSMTMKEIIFPQAIKNILPALANEFIAVIKETAVVAYIGVADIMYNTNLVRSVSYNNMGTLFIAAAMYFIMTFTLSKLVGIWERKLKTSD